MVQSVSTSGNIAAILMAATQARKETEEKARQQAAAETMSLAGKDPDDGDDGGDDTEKDLEELATPPVRPTNAAKPPKRGPRQQELRDRQYDGGVEAERERREAKTKAAKAYMKAGQERLKTVNEANTFTDRIAGGRSHDLAFDLEDVRARGGQAAVDDFLRKQFPEFAEQQDSGMKMNPSQAERKADRRRENNRRATTLVTSEKSLVKTRPASETDLAMTLLV